MSSSETGDNELSATTALTGLGPVITMFTILLIVASNTESVGKPIGPGTPTTAPQAQALQSELRSIVHDTLPDRPLEVRPEPVAIVTCERSDAGQR